MMLGIEPSKVRTGYAKFDVQNPPLNLTLNEVAFSGKGALSHLGIQVGSTDDVLAMREKWARAGLVTRDEMQTNCCYATQDKTWVRDPDGNEWEVFVVLKDNLPETAPCECGEKVSEANSRGRVGCRCILMLCAGASGYRKVNEFIADCEEKRKATHKRPGSSEEPGHSICFNSHND